MGHASLEVSLGYLRNLEVPMLKVEDMPMFNASWNHSHRNGSSDVQKFDPFNLTDCSGSGPFQTIILGGKAFE